MSYLLRRLGATLGLAALLQGCGGNVDVDVADPGPLPQGIFGTVTRSTGDFMCCPGNGKVEPIAVPVHIIRGEVAYVNEASPSLADLPEEISVQSGADGTYGAGLPPGTYTTFVEIDGELWWNHYQGTPTSNIYLPTEVVAGVFSRRDIDDNSGASY